MMVLLNDIDCSTVLEKAVESAKLATRLDHEGHYDKALEHYDRAVRDLAVYVDNESCQVVVDCVLAKLQLYVQRAHVLRDFVEYGDIGDSGECRDYAGGGGGSGSGSGGYIGTATRSPTTAAPQLTQLVAATGGSRTVASDGADSACVSMKRCGDRARFDDSVSGSTSDSGVYELDSGRSSHNTSHDDAVADFEVSEMEVVCDRRPKEHIVASGVAPLASHTDTGGAAGWARSRSGDTHSRHKFLTACHHHMAELLQIVQDDAATADARCRAQERLDQIKRFADMYNSRLAVHSVDSRTAHHPSSASPAPSRSSSGQTRPALAAAAAPCLSRASSLASLPSLSAVDIGDRVLAERRPCQRLVRVEVLHSAASVANRQLAAAVQQQQQEQQLPARSAAAAASSRGHQQGGQDATCRRSPQSQDMQDFPRLPLDGSDDFQSPSTFGSAASVNTVADYYAETRVKVAQSPHHHHQHHNVQSADQLDAIEPATPSVSLAKPTVTQATPTVTQATPTLTRASSSDEHMPSPSLAHSPPPAAPAASAAVAADVTSTMYTFESQHLAEYFDGGDAKELYEKPGLFWHLLGCLCG